MIGAGSCMNREAAISGCPTISICPDRLPGVDRFLIDKGLMLHSLEEKEILEKSIEMINSKKRNNAHVIKGFEDPHEKIMEAVGTLR